MVSMGVQGLGQAELARLAARLREAGRGDLRRQLDSRLRSAARPLVTELKGAIRSTPVSGARGGGGRQRARHVNAALPTGLRESIAQAVTLSVRSTGRYGGVRIRVDRQQLPRSQRSLPGHLDTGRWRHPTFGHRPWVTQTARPGWWTQTVRRRTPGMQAQVRRVLDDIARRI
jgi:hypothetical protein